jgi:phosphatidylglycerophosphate synthase
MTPSEPLLPLVVLSAFFIVCLPLFALDVRRRGLHRDVTIEHRKVGPLLGRWLMYYLLWLIAPVERLLVRLNVAPNTLTLMSLLLSAGAGAALALGRFGLGGWLYIFTGIFDILDGRVARAGGRATRGGAFYDSIADRWAEAIIFAGLAWRFRGGWVLLLCIGALVASFMVSYARARGEALGSTAGDAGAMQRPERILYLGVGLALSPLAGPSLAVIAIAMVAAISLVTAVRRSLAIARQLGQARPDVEAPAEPNEDDTQPSPSLFV